MSNPKKSRDQAGKQARVSGRYVADAKIIKDKDPVAFEAVRKGEKTISQVKREMKEKVREERRALNRLKVQHHTIESPLKTDAKFATIAIDPPWSWDDEGDVNQLGRAKPDYATLSIEEIANLPIPMLADDDCHLYLWITNRSLPKGFDLIEKWGFRYVTALTWIKPSFGLGNYFRGSTEHILFAVKGSQPLKRKDVGTWFQAPRGGGGHSSKPVQFYELVESCSPGPYLDMFSRQNRKGWATWGEAGQK